MDTKWIQKICTNLSRLLIKSNSNSMLTYHCKLTFPLDKEFRVVTEWMTNFLEVMAGFYTTKISRVRL